MPKRPAFGLAEVQRANSAAIANLDEGFFRVRFDRARPKNTVICVPWPNWAKGRINQATSPIAKGMIWRPTHGDTAFAVPMFDAFMKRIMPDEDWRKLPA